MREPGGSYHVYRPADIGPEGHSVAGRRRSSRDLRFTLPGGSPRPGNRRRPRGTRRPRRRALPRRSPWPRPRLRADQRPPGKPRRTSRTRCSYRPRMLSLFDSYVAGRRAAPGSQQAIIARRRSSPPHVECRKAKDKPLAQSTRLGVCLTGAAWRTAFGTG